jgi:hypothetical protein
MPFDRKEFCDDYEFDFDKRVEGLLKAKRSSEKKFAEAESLLLESCDDWTTNDEFWTFCLYILVPHKVL